LQKKEVVTLLATTPSCVLLKPSYRSSQLNEVQLKAVTQRWHQENKKADG
jgi:hypothetical protein